METNMGPYKRIFICIFPNGEKLETTYIPDTENCLIYVVWSYWKMLTVYLLSSEQRRFHHFMGRIPAS